MKKLHTPCLSTGFSEDGKKAKKRFENILSGHKKRSYFLIFTLIVSIFSAELLISCGSGKTEITDTAVCAFVKEINGSTIVVDIAEYITPDDTDRIEELGITHSDMINGYYIYNPETELNEYTLSDETVYNFIDWKNDFVEEGADRNVNTAKKEDFIKYLSTYENSQPGMPFFFTLAGDKVVSITEKMMM